MMIFVVLCIGILYLSAISVTLSDGFTVHILGFNLENKLLSVEMLLCFVEEATALRHGVLLFAGI